MERIIEAGNRTIRLFTEGDRAPLVVLNTFEGEGEAVYAGVRALTNRPFSLAAVGGLDWNGDLSPWPCPPVFRGEAPFSGGADGYLARLTGEMLPQILGALGEKPAGCVLAGYSMAGLFALYGLYRSPLFDGAVCASGSFWYPGFVEYVREHEPARRPSALYFSVGDREARTRNPVMRTVERNTALLADWYAERGIDTRFELNPGNHFQDAAGRMARGIAWMLERPALI